MNFRRISSITHKEMFHISRDPFTLALGLGLPLVLVTVFGLAIEFNLTEIRISMFDADRSTSSRALVETFESSNYFKVRHDRELFDAINGLETERMKGVLIIEKGFEKSLFSKHEKKVQFLLDGTDNSTAGIIMNYLVGIQKIAIERLTGLKLVQPVNLHTRFLFNPELNTQWFIIPGLIVIITAILSILLTALTIAREWENGSMELLLSTTAKPIEIVIGKLIPYVIMGFIAITLVYLLARFGFRVPFRGSHLVFSAGVILFISTYLSQGLLISVITRKQALAMQVAFISGLLPSILFSGFIFPIENMPTFFEYFTGIFPARWFMTICRGVFLRGASFMDLIKPFEALFILQLLLVVAAALRFKKDLEP